MGVTKNKGEVRNMEIDYKKVFGAFNKYLDESFNEMNYAERNGHDYLEIFFKNQFLRREVAAAYYLSDSVSEERFLKLCDELDNILYDDYKDMYERDSIIVGIPLQHYIEKLQHITGKHPGTVHKWLYLKVTAGKEEKGLG